MKKFNFYELQGYNKVGQNTFPNMIPFLTGHHWQELVSKNALKNTSFDKWPIIWKDYTRKGFVTLFVEEMSKYGLFQWYGEGFVKNHQKDQLDYQTRAFNLEIRSQKHNHYCYKWKTETEVLISILKII